MQTGGDTITSDGTGAPVEAPVQVPVEAPVEAPVQAPVEAPVEAPGEPYVDMAGHSYSKHVTTQLVTHVSVLCAMECPQPRVWCVLAPAACCVLATRTTMRDMHPCCMKAT
jgi:hypothetical protein